MKKLHCLSVKRVSISRRSILPILWLPLLSLAGCNTPVGPGTNNPHGSLPGLFASDEVWAIVSGTALGADETGPLFIMRGFGNTIEYAAVSKSVLDSTQSVFVGLDFTLGSVTLENGVLEIRAEFVDWAGVPVHTVFRSVVCDAALSQSGPIKCDLATPELTLEIEGEPQNIEEVSFRLSRLESCPKSLNIASSSESQWAISSVPVLALLLAVNSPAAEEFPVSLLLISGAGAQAQSAIDATGFGEGTSEGCVRGPDFGDTIPAEAVQLDGSSMQIDIDMTHVTTVGEISTENGTCRVTLQSEVTYCALWQPEDDGSGAPSEAVYIFRVDGTGQRDRGPDGSSDFNHAYVFVGPSQAGEPIGP